MVACTRTAQDPVSHLPEWSRNLSELPPLTEALWTANSFLGKERVSFLYGSGPLTVQHAPVVSPRPRAIWTAHIEVGGLFEKL